MVIQNQVHITHFSISFFSDNFSANKIEMIFLVNMCIFIGKNLVVFRNCYLSLHSFLVKNAKITFFLVLSVVFIKFTCR